MLLKRLGLFPLMLVAAPAFAQQPQPGQPQLPFDQQVAQGAAQIDGIKSSWQQSLLALKAGNDDLAKQVADLKAQLAKLQPPAEATPPKP